MIICKILLTCSDGYSLLIGPPIVTFEKLKIMHFLSFWETEAKHSDYKINAVRKPWHIIEAMRKP